MRTPAVLGDVDARRPAVRARMRQLLDGLAVAGLLLAVLGGAAGWRMAGALDANSRRSIEVTIASLDSIERTVATADEVLVGATDTLAAVGSTVEQVDRSFATTTELSAGVAELADTLAPALEDTGTALRQLEDVGTEIDTLLAGLSALPLAPDYRPSSGLGPTFGDIADDLAPLPDSLRTTSESLRNWEASSGDLQTDVRALADAVAQLNDRLADSTELIGRYQTNIADARAAADAARRDLRTNAVLLRALLVVGSLTFAAMQLVPWWLARQLAAETVVPARSGTADRDGDAGDGDGKFAGDPGARRNEADAPPTSAPSSPAAS